MKSFQLTTIVQLVFFVTQSIVKNTLGLISKLNYDVSDELEVQVGIDWRSAAIEHAREVRDFTWWGTTM